MRFSATLILILLCVGVGLCQTDKPESIQPREASRRIISRTFTEIPSRVRGFHAVGTINVLVIVNEVGKAEMVNVLSGFSHVDFMREYIEKEVSSWKFKPLKRNNKYVPFRGVISIPFYYGTFPKKMPS
jgi:hypothetical protein